VGGCLPDLPARIRVTVIVFVAILVVLLTGRGYETDSMLRAVVALAAAAEVVGRAIAGRRVVAVGGRGDRVGRNRDRSVGM
jgi:hypothetical protein